MKLVIALAALVGLGSVAATILVGSRLFEEKVTPDPWEAGLRWDDEQRRAARPDCAISAGPCTRPAGPATSLTLEISPRPVRAMADLTFTVGALPAPPEGSTGEISLAMPGMYMGENRVRLERLPDGRLRGRGVIVRCPSRGRTWSARVALRPPGGAPLGADFTFDLAE